MRKSIYLGPLRMHIAFVSLLVATLPHIALGAPGASANKIRDATTSGEILDGEFDRWLNALGKDWGMKGISVAVVQRGADDTQWAVETKGYGVKNQQGTPVTSDVRLCHYPSAFGENDTVYIDSICYWLQLETLYRTIPWSPRHQSEYHPDLENQGCESPS